MMWGWIDVRAKKNLSNFENLSNFQNGKSAINYEIISLKCFSISLNWARQTLMYIYLFYFKLSRNDILHNKFYNWIKICVCFLRFSKYANENNAFLTNFRNWVRLQCHQKLSQRAIKGSVTHFLNGPFFCSGTFYVFYT